MPEEEVATVRKSLEQLKQVELNPFFAVTTSDEPTEVVDGLLVSHIRYQGFQGNIRATTRPVSFDATALSTILALPEFATWRTNGGLVVSDNLGSAAVREFYAQSGETYSPRSVARDAFLAGNDLLYLGNITSEIQRMMLILPHYGYLNFSHSNIGVTLTLPGLSTRRWRGSLPKSCVCMRTSLSPMY